MYCMWLKWKCGTTRSPFGCAPGRLVILLSPACTHFLSFPVNPGLSPMSFPAVSGCLKGCFFLNQRSLSWLTCCFSTWLKFLIVMSTSSNCDYFLLKGLFRFIGLNLNCLPYNTITKPFLFISSSFPPSSANKKPNILLVRAMVMQWSETSKMWESLFKHAYHPELYRCRWNINNT